MARESQRRPSLNQRAIAQRAQIDQLLDFSELVEGDFVGVLFADPGDVAPVSMRGTLALAAAATPGWELSTRAAFDPRADTELWTDFASDGRLDPASPVRADPPTAGPAGAALAATTILGPGERRSVRFALAWDLPMVEFDAGRRWWKRYTRSWGSTGTRAWDIVVHALSRNGCAIAAPMVATRTRA